MPHILLIMRKPGNIRVLSRALESHSHVCAGVNSQEALNTMLEQNPTPDLALVDVTGFGETVWSMCERLRGANVPFVVLSAKQEWHFSSKTLGYGATSILEKPVVKASLLQLITDITQERA